MIAPEVGGGFGQKLQVYGEEVLACWCSRKLERPVKWIETRTENMAVAHQGRDQIATVRMGASGTARSPPSTSRSSPTSARTTCC